MLKDNANGYFYRIGNSLSCGETFMILQLKCQRPLEIFFLDEGFRTLSVLGYGNHPALEYGWTKAE